MWLVERWHGKMAGRWPETFTELAAEFYTTVGKDSEQAHSVNKDGYVKWGKCKLGKEILEETKQRF